MSTISTANRKDKTEQWREVLTELYSRFQDHGEQAVKTFDDEDVHQARVNCRKLMTLMRILDPADQTGLLPVFKKAQKRLGKVRDADVMIDAFKEKRKQVKKQEQHNEAELYLLKAVINEHKAERKFYREKMRKKLPALQGKKLKKHWKLFIQEQLPELAAEADVNRLMRELEIAYDQKKKTYRQLAKEQGIQSSDTLNALHKVRIAAKELRYTAEAASFALNSKFRDHESTYKQIQKDLGEVNDRHVWIETIEELNANKLKIDQAIRDQFVQQLRKEMIGIIQEQERKI